MALDPALGAAYRQLKRGPSVTVGSFVLTPVVLEERKVGATARGCWFVAAKRPVAVIVAGPCGHRLLRLENIAQSNSENHCHDEYSRAKKGRTI